MVEVVKATVVYEVIPLVCVFGKRFTGYVVLLGDDPRTANLTAVFCTELFARLPLVSVSETYQS